MKLQDPMKTVRSLVGDGAIKSDRCCGESGTLAVSRPDVSTQVRFRKQEELLKGADAARRRLQRRREGVDVLSVLPAGPVAPRGRHRHGRRLHRGRDGAPHPGRRLDGRLCAPRQRGRHRARAGVAVTRPPAGGYRCLANARRFRRAFCFARRQRRPMACMVTMYQITLSLNLLLMARRLMPRFPAPRSWPPSWRRPACPPPRAAARIRSAPGRRC